MIGPDGAEWVTIAEAARRVRVREDLIRQWKRRGRVRAHRLEDVHETWVHLGDVARAEVAWRRRVKARQQREQP